MVKEQVANEKAAVEFQLARLERVVRDAAENLRGWADNNPENAREAVIAAALIRELLELRTLLGIASPRYMEE